MLLRNRFFLFFVLALVHTSCHDNKLKDADTATSGEVKISVDASFHKLFKTQVSTFEAIYPNAKIHTTYLPESDLYLRLLNDSCKVIIMGRDLTKNETEVLNSKNLFPVTTKIAEDAIVLIANPSCNIAELTVMEVKQILLGTYKEKLNVVFDNEGSANNRYMKDSLLKRNLFSSNVFALNNDEDVINYVASNKNTLGILSFNQISDFDDTSTSATLKKIKVVAIAKDTESKAIQPYQAYIKTKEYPFCRNIYMINRQTSGGLGKGFVIFVAGEKGQLIVLKSGLVPAFPPQRIIQINTN